MQSQVYYTMQFLQESRVIQLIPAIFINSQFCAKIRPNPNNAKCKLNLHIYGTDGEENFAGLNIIRFFPDINGTKLLNSGGK